MIKVNEIKGFMARDGITMAKLAEELDMTPKTLYIRMKRGEFNNFEMEKMISLFGIEDPVRIFFADCGA